MAKSPSILGRDISTRVAYQQTDSFVIFHSLLHLMVGLISIEVKIGRIIQQRETYFNSVQILVGRSRCRKSDQERQRIEAFNLIGRGGFLFFFNFFVFFRFFHVTFIFRTATKCADLKTQILSNQILICSIKSSKLFGIQEPFHQIR